MAIVHDSITDYSKTQRIVLLLDLNPLLHLQDPEAYLNALFASAKTLISLPSLSSSLFSFKPFFSSLSPLLSSSKLPSLFLSLSFDRPDSTLHSLNAFLSSPSLKNFSSKTARFSSSPRAVNVAASMRQLVHDYAWDPDDKVNNFTSVRSNLVVLLSPVVKSMKCLSEFLDVDVSDECLGDVALFNRKFRGFFESVNAAFCSRDIHFSWVDVKYELDCSDIDEFELKSRVFDSGTKDLGWGFCSSDSIVLGSALVHFELIYPIIGVSASHLFNCNNDYCKPIRAQLNLEILDVSGKPLECKVGDLELVYVEIFSRNRVDDVLIPSEFMDLKTAGCEKNRFWGQFGEGIIKLHVKAVYNCKEGDKFEGRLLDSVLVHECLGESVNNRHKNSSEFFADKVLKILAREMGGSLPRKDIPIWQIFLSFLYRKSYWALVSILDGNGESHLGILKPFTIFSALLSIVNDGSSSNTKVHKVGGANSHPFATKMDDEICKSNTIAAVGEVKGKKKKSSSHLLQDLTWVAFCKAAFGSTVIDLEDVYLSRACNNSKKLKFLKCWMKQIEKSSSCSLMIGERSMLQTEVPKEIENRLAELPRESEWPISSSGSVGEESMGGASRIKDDSALNDHSETSESFFSNLSSKIQRGVESEGVDLGALAERLVNSSVYWLCQKLEIKNTSESQTPVVKPDKAYSMVAVELSKLLLREPKDLIAIHKNDGPKASGFASEIIVREYELQILLRMEILQSEVGESVEEPVKQKFVKQICLLFETIQCHLQGGFFGDWSLDNYVQKIVKSRYSDTLGDVVHRIYLKMDLLLFAKEDESPNSLLNSEESNPSRREEIGENGRVNKSVSLEDEPLRPQEDDDESPQVFTREEHARRVLEAQERRERARRFSSFTSWVPDLQRVWAPKQPKAVKPKTLRKLSNRKDRKRASYDKVRETPMTGNKRPCSLGSSNDDEDNQDAGTRLSGSVSKALFQDDRLYKIF